MILPKTKRLHEEWTSESPHSEYHEVFIYTWKLCYDYVRIVDYVRYWKRLSDNILKTERVVSFNPSFNKSFGTHAFYQGGSAGPPAVSKPITPM